MSSSPNDGLYVIARLGAGRFAVPASYVQEIIMLPKWSRVPNAPPHVRGVVNLRGKVLPVTDLRMVLGLTSLPVEVETTIEMLTAREADHLRWLGELEAAVRDNREFKLARDPHLCAFGKWYYAYKTEDRALGTVLAKFEQPHRRIHELADVVLELARGGHVEKALATIEETRGGDLGRVIELFEITRQTYRTVHREMALIVEDRAGNRRMAITIDEVEKIDRIEQDRVEEIAPTALGAGAELTPKAAKTAGGEALAMVLDMDRLVALTDAA